MGHFLKRHQLALAGLLAAGSAILLYWPILALPLSFDDLLHIRLVKGLDYLSVWLPSADFPFYRPVLFLPVLLARTLFGYYPSLPLYALNLGLHGLNATLLAWLVWRLRSRWSLAAAAGLLFATYPFAYQAVAVFGNNIYPLLVALILLGLHSYLLALAGRPRWWLATAVFFIVGLLGHELVIIFGPLTALVHWAERQTIVLGGWQWGQRPRPHQFTPQRLIRQTPYTLFILFSLIYWFVYQFIPVGTLNLAFGNNAFWPRLLYLLQSAGYPLAWFSNRLPGPTTEFAVVVSILLLALLSLWAGRRPATRTMLLLGWGWWAIASLILLVSLPTDYLLHGPRLIYLGSAGGAIVLALILDELFQRRTTGKVIWALTLLAICLVSGWFVRGRIVALANLGVVIPLFSEIMPEQPADEGVLLVNLPAYRSPTQPTFPVGVELVSLMGEHLFAEELVWENLNQVRPVSTMTVPELLNEAPYTYGTHNQTDKAVLDDSWAPAGAHIFISRFGPDGVEAAYAGRVGPGSENTRPLASFGSSQLEALTAVACDNTVTVNSTWRLAADLPGTASLFVQVVGGDGRLLAQQDGPPLQLSPDRLALPAAWEVTDRRQLPLPSPESDSRLLIGIYDYVDGVRFPARAADGTPLPDDAFVLPVTPCTTE